MGWGTDFTPDIFISRESFSNISVLKDRIKEVEDDINQIETLLQMFAVATPTKIDMDNTESYPDLVNSIYNHINSTLEDYRSLIILRYKLDLLLEEVEAKKVILAPQN